MKSKKRLSMSSKPTQPNNPRYFPFNRDQLNHFNMELKQAGGFHKLMFQKKALCSRMGMKYICQYHDQEKYRNKYLTGVYEPLRPFYDTEMPFIFWSELYEVLLANEFDL